MGILDTLSKLKSGLSKTRDSFVGKVQQLAAAKSAIDDEMLNQLEDILIASDVGVQTADNILSRLKHRVKDEKVRIYISAYFFIKRSNGNGLA